MAQARRYGANWKEGMYWLDLERPAPNFVGGLDMARGPWAPQVKAGWLVSLLGAGEASCVIGLSSVERPLWGSAVLFSKVTVSGFCLFLPRGLSLPLLVGCVMSEGDRVQMGWHGGPLSAGSATRVLAAGHRPGLT